MINDGRAGLEELRRDKGNYDFVLLDLAMPWFSDVKVIFNKLKEENLMDAKDIVIFTASSQKGQRNADGALYCTLSLS